MPAATICLLVLPQVVTHAEVQIQLRTITKVVAADALMLLACLHQSVQIAIWRLLARTGQDQQ